MQNARFTSKSLHIKVAGVCCGSSMCCHLQGRTMLNQLRAIPITMAIVLLAPISEGRTQTVTEDETRGAICYGVSYGRLAVAQTSAQAPCPPDAKTKEQCDALRRLGAMSVPPAKADFDRMRQWLITRGLINAEGKVGSRGNMPFTAVNFAFQQGKKSALDCMGASDAGKPAPSAEDTRVGCKEVELCKKWRPI